MDEDEEAFGGMYENGHWIWNEKLNCLEYDRYHELSWRISRCTRCSSCSFEEEQRAHHLGLVHDRLSNETEEQRAFTALIHNRLLTGTQLVNNKFLSSPHSSAARVQEDQAVMAISSKPPTGGTVHFRDDVDVVEQIRFRRRYQRKIRPGDPEVITLQDVKDLALYTAPLNILSPLLIDLLHQTTTERFIRALILYCQYYLQVLEEMNFRKVEAQTKIRTQASEIQERTYESNLSDLRVLVAKEYSVMLVGGEDTTRFHHMGENKKRKSLSNRDARLSETLLQMVMQIVWLALGRKSFNQLELEIHRLFKSETFNVVEHNLKTGYIENMTQSERAVLLGGCVRHDRKLHTRSPLSNEIFCYREVDYTMMGIGAISYPHLTERVAYMANAISAPEDMLKMCGVTIGIIGMDRSRFDTMLRPLPAPPDKSSKETRPQVGFKRASSIKKSTVNFNEKVYPDIVLPSTHQKKIKFPSAFPHNTFMMPTCCFVQRSRWQKRLKKLMKGPKNQSRC